MAKPTYTLRRVGASAAPPQQLALANRLRPFFKGDKGDKGDTAAPSTEAGNLLSVDPSGALLLLDATVRQIAADQDAVKVYDFDALVSATLGV